MQCLEGCKASKVIKVSFLYRLLYRELSQHEKIDFQSLINTSINKNFADFQKHKLLLSR